jgi:hypothetical protein
MEQKASRSYAAIRAIGVEDNAQSRCVMTVMSIARSRRGRVVDRWARPCELGGVVIGLGMVWESFSEAKPNLLSPTSLNVK